MICNLNLINTLRISKERVMLMLKCYIEGSSHITVVALYSHDSRRCCEWMQAVLQKAGSCWLSFVGDNCSPWYRADWPAGHCRLTDDRRDADAPWAPAQDFPCFPL